MTTMTETDRQPWEGWAILELMGHRRLGGFISEASVAGAAMVRIDVPGKDEEPGASQFYSSQAVYAITPTTEEIARALAQRERPAPVSRWDLPGLTKDSQEVAARPVYCITCHDGKDLDTDIECDNCGRVGSPF